MKYCPWQNRNIKEYAAYTEDYSSNGTRGDAGSGMGLYLYGDGLIYPAGWIPEKIYDPATDWGTDWINNWDV